MNLVDLIALLALMQLIFFGASVARARTRYGVQAPAVSGHELFERAYRVQMNTLELLVIMLPSLYLSAKYANPTLSAIAGAVYLLGRMIYWRAYNAKPKSRTFGFALSLWPIGVMMVAALVGIAKTLM